MARFGATVSTTTATESGWVWTPLDVAHAPAIAQAIAILDGGIADFVKLPIRIQ